MQFRPRQTESQPPAAGAPPAGESADDPVAQARQQGAAYLAATDAIINASLSGNSQAFLAATRQQGGQ